jgi:hypothetical protein
VTGATHVVGLSELGIGHRKLPDAGARGRLKVDGAMIRMSPMCGRTAAGALRDPEGTHDEVPEGVVTREATSIPQREA